MPPSSSISLQIPPAHSISELALPSTLERRISDVPELEEDSSDEDSRPVEVVENARYATANANVARRFSLRTTRSRENSGSNTTSSGTGTGTGSFSQPASSTLASPNHFLSHTAPDRERKTSGRFFSSIAGLFRSGGNIGIGHPGSSEKWKTRTESNLRSVRRSTDSDSENEALTESPSRRFFRRRASHDTPPPPSPATPQKLRKLNGREKEKDQGWISDGAAVRGRDARKGSAKKRIALQDGSPRPARRTVPTSTHTRSSSVVSVGSSVVSSPGSSTPTPTKPGTKPKTDLRVEALTRSSTTDVSRQSSLRSSGSVPPVLRRNAGERAAGLPPSQTSPSSAVGHSSSLVQHRRSRSVPYASPHADAGRAGSSQMSLMAIVENVTRDNRTAWDRANAGLPPESAGSSNAVGGLLSVRAPPSVTQYNLRGEGGSGIAFESVLAPSSVFATSPSAPSTSQRQSSVPLTPPPRVPVPPTPPGAAPKIPLRSALRNHSPPPVPPPKPIVVPLAPPRVVVESAMRAHNGGGREDEGSDNGSIASFRTVRETFEEELTPTPPPAPAPVPAPVYASSSALAVPGQDDSDVSASTVSANGGGGASGPARRKSVRMSLQPTFSPPPPPALDDDEDEAWERSGRGRRRRGAGGAANGVPAHDGDEEDDEENGRGRKNGNGRERDFWADSSDEDEEYSKARRMLTRANRKRW